MPSWPLPPERRRSAGIGPLRPLPVFLLRESRKHSDEFPLEDKRAVWYSVQ